VMVVFEDWMAPPLRQLCRNLKSSLKEWGYMHETLKPQKLPTQLPPEVQKAYDAEFACLPERGAAEDEGD